MGATRQIILRVVGVLGAVLFGFFFALTYSVPDWVESFGSSFIEGKVSNGLDQAIDLLRVPEGKGALSKIAKAVEARNADKIGELKENLRSKVHVQFANALAEIRDLDCDCRQKWEDTFKSSLLGNVSLLQAANDKIVDFIQAKYMDVVHALKRDIRIFTGVNALVFLTLLFVSLLKPKAVVHLFLPGVLLVVSTVICSYFYIFQQDWLLTIIYSDYLGFGYLAYLAVVFGILGDIALNHGAITTAILNAFFNAIGSALTIVPC